MRVAMLGTGTVGRTLGTRLVELGEQVRMGSREPHGGAEWAQQTGEGASAGTYADAAAFGELVVNATAGAGSLSALQSVPADATKGKVLVDVANPIAAGSGMPPQLTIANTDSLGEQIQAARPEARVVKALNTVNAGVMVRPELLAEPTDLFVCGEDPEAKRQVAGLLERLGWARERIRDLGGIEAARGTEMYLAFWLRLMGSLSTPQFNVRVVGEG